MKLELKHLSPYLPYKLNYKDNNGRIVKLNTLDFGVDLVNMGWGNALEVWKVKPILRPLSDLTKVIEVNGKKFVPLRRLNEDSEYPLLIDDGVFFTDACELNMLEITSIYEIFQKLFEWHFDVFGLIESDLAIDINTL